MLCLRVPELVVFAVLLCHQLAVAAELRDPSAVEHRDAIAEAAGGKPVRDKHAGLLADELVEFGVDFKLGDGIERGGRLVQHDDGRVFIQRARNGDLLLFPAGEVPAVLVGLLANGDVIATLEFLDEII